ncbi:hypothetical protein BGV50_03105 [Burkholderia ubonensis]|nr:hypothetical protein BGV50_03105 [Burkholderia ubonensis]
MAGAVHALAVWAAQPSTGGREPTPSLVLRDAFAPARGHVTTNTEILIMAMKFPSNLKRQRGAVTLLETLGVLIVAGLIMPSVWGWLSDDAFSKINRPTADHDKQVVIAAAQYIKDNSFHIPPALLVSGHRAEYPAGVSITSSTSPLLRAPRKSTPMYSNTTCLNRAFSSI